MGAALQHRWRGVGAAWGRREGGMGAVWWGRDDGVSTGSCCVGVDAVLGHCQDGMGLMQGLHMVRVEGCTS